MPETGAGYHSVLSGRQSEQRRPEQCELEPEERLRGRDRVEHTEVRRAKVVPSLNSPILT